MSNQGPVSAAPRRGVVGLLRRGAGKVWRTVAGTQRRAPAPPEPVPAPPPVAAAPAAPARPAEPDISNDPRRQLTPDEVAAHQAEYDAQARHFHSEVKRRGLGDVS